MSNIFDIARSTGHLYLLSPELAEKEEALRLEREHAEAMAELKQGRPSEHPEPRSKSQEYATQKPLGPTERDTLLVIIAALCGPHPDINHQAHGSATKVSRMTEKIGAPVSHDSVKRAFRDIPNALESRTK